VTVAIIVGLFLIQRGGTARIGQLFGPIMVLWFAVLALLGLTNAIQHPAVFGAINPLYAARFFAANGWHGFLILGTVFLVVTGGEALYADMGHFGRRPIRLAWVGFVLPALLLNYFGQGALLLRTPEAADNVFYLLAPSWALYPLVALATLATIIASQALISGAYSLTMQAEHLGMLPRVQIVHTSPTAYGQIYIPFVNWTLMVACILVVIGFRTSSNLAAAYGIAVTSTMAITPLIFAVVARRRWRWATGVVALVTGFFLVIDTAFLAANLVKIPQGGWFPLVIAALLILVMTTWRHGNQLVFAREQDLELSLARLLERIRTHAPHRVPGTAVFLSANPLGAPAALLANMRDNGVLHDHVLLLSVRTGEVPHVDPAERIVVDALGHGIYRGTIRYGFMEEPNVPQALALASAPELQMDPEQVPYFVSRTRVLATALPGMALWREQLFTLLRRNAASPADFFCLPPGRVFEIGTTVEV
jgi:KUP system potassium uptake protein